jgi:hypothetical protein
MTADGGGTDLRALRRRVLSDKEQIDMESLENIGLFLDSLPGFAVIVAVQAMLLAALRPLLRKVVGREYLGQGLTVAAILLCSLGFLILTFWFPVEGDVPAATMPRIWILGIFACCIYVFKRIVDGQDDPDATKVDLALPMKFIALSIAYLVLMALVGYYLSSILFILSAIALLEYRRRIVAVAVAAGWVAFAYIVFFKILFVPLPEGILVRALFG